MKMLTSLESLYWQSYLRTAPEAAGFLVEAKMAGSPGIADVLLGLFLSGRKTAGSSLVEDYLSAGDPLPSVGRHWIVLDARGTPSCILRTERVERQKFRDIPDRVAIAEGEGDLSLEHWRKIHSEFFKPFLHGWGLKHIEQATVLTEFFRFVHR
jgi:uncharacterized protein YhfF